MHCEFVFYCRIRFFTKFIIIPIITVFNFIAVSAFLRYLKGGKVQFTRDYTG